MTTLKTQVISGTIWTIIGYGASQAIRFGGNLILTRLLFPELFGLMALVNIFIIGLQLFSDIGTSWSVVQSPRGDDPKFLNTAWTADVIRGLGLWLVCLLIAWPLATLYGYPQLRWLIPIVGFSTVLSGFESTAEAQLERHLEVQQQTRFELTVQVLGLMVMIAWAWIRPSIWALVAGGLVSASVKMVWSHYLLPGAGNQFAWEPEAARALFAKGRWIFTSTALTFLAEQTDRLILGDLFSLKVLGVYGIALTLSDLPRQVVVAISHKVIFPAVSKQIDQPRPVICQTLLRYRKSFLLALILLMILMAGFGDLLVQFLYDDRYLAAAWMLPVLALGIWPRLLAHTSEPYLLALGKFEYTTYGNLLRLICTAIGIGLGFITLGTLGAVIGVALNDLFYYLVVNTGLTREGLNGWGQDLMATSLLLGGLALVFWGRSVGGWGSPMDALL